MSIADKLKVIAENEQRVYESGYENGYGSFWDGFQQNGNRDNYDYGIMGAGWTDETFRPKHKLKFVGKNTYIFGYSQIVDLKSTMARCGFYELDFTQSTDTNYIFRWSIVKYCPKVITGAKTTINGLFPYAEKLEIIEELVLNANNTNHPRFDCCYELLEMNISGVVQRTLYAKDCSKLITSDAINTIQHLKNCSGTSDEYKYSVNFHADVWARLDALGNNSPNGNTWKEYVVDLGWNVG